MESSTETEARSWTAYWFDWLTDIRDGVRGGRYDLHDAGDAVHAIRWQALLLSEQAQVLEAEIQESLRPPPPPLPEQIPTYFGPAPGYGGMW